MNHKCVHERVYLQLFLFRDVAKIFLFWKMHMHIITGGIGFSVLAILLKLPRLNIHANCIKGGKGSVQAIQYSHATHEIHSSVL